MARKTKRDRKIIDKPQELNKVCLTCTKKCKQFANVEIEVCLKYEAIKTK